MKNITKLLLLSFALCGSTFAHDARVGYTRGTSNTKGDAFVNAITLLPQNAKIKHTEVNGYAMRRYVPGVGYIQTNGKYECKIYYSK